MLGLARTLGHGGDVIIPTPRPADVLKEFSIGMYSLAVWALWKIPSVIITTTNQLIYTTTAIIFATLGYKMNSLQDDLYSPSMEKETRRQDQHSMEGN